MGYEEFHLVQSQLVASAQLKQIVNTMNNTLLTSSYNLATWFKHLNARKSSMPQTEARGPSWGASDTVRKGVQRSQNLKMKTSGDSLKMCGATLLMFRKPVVSQDGPGQKTNFVNWVFNSIGFLVALQNAT